MPSQPPRRRRSQRDDRGLPLLPVLLGVVLLGFAVGAVLSMTSAQHEDAQVAQTQPSSSPQADITPFPLPSVRKLRARPKLTPYPAVVPTIAHTAQPPVEPSVEPTDEPSATVAPSPTATPTPIATLAPVVKIPATAQTEAPVATSTPAAAVAESAPVIEVDSEFAQEAAQAVRAYLTALRQGDEDAASAQLAPGLSLSEEAFMNRTAHITRIHATGTSTDASVQARVTADQGAYVATFSVERGPKGPVIRAHDFEKAK